MCIAISLMLSFVACKAIAFTWHWKQHSIFSTAIVVLVLEWLSSGLFLTGSVLHPTPQQSQQHRTAHDAWHRSLAPRHPALNDALGQLALLLHGFFSYPKLKRIHLNHHAHHGDLARDPDAAPSQRAGFWRWFASLALVYATPHQVLCLAASLVACACVLGVPPLHLFFFSIIPLAASVLRLFVFLTYLPHRVGTDRDTIRTFTGPKWAAFVLGFNAVYHAQHHWWPHLPWWRLAAVA